MSQATEDHDSPWKEALGLFLQPFLQLLYPDIHKAIDWTRDSTFLDKELQKLTPTGHTGRRYADKLVQVWFRDGRSRWLLIHVEVQGQRDATFPERMFVYYHRIREHYGKEVISLAVLTDTHPDYRPDRFEEVVVGSGVSFRFRTVKLLDFRDRLDELQASDNPFALLIAAQLTAKLEKNGKRRADKLLDFCRLAAEKRLDEGLIIQLWVFLEWLVTLPPEIKDGYYTVQLKRLREEKTVPYISVIERICMEEGLAKGLQEGRLKGLQEGRVEGLQEGRVEGQQEGRATMLLRQLQLKFGELPEAVRQRVARADQTELDLWAERILFAHSIDGVLADQ